MAELADALDLGSSGATRTGSIPARCTSTKITTESVVFFLAIIHFPFITSMGKKIKKEVYLLLCAIIY